MAAPSLYRRYRPASFAQVRGQDHVVGPIRNAVRSGTESHAYLFSGPRGTGKTSTARILAKALNCTDLRDGEPCGACDSCVAIEAGSSMDLFELDAASNNKVDDMRSLIGGTVVASPGRTKVYILDEVHMLSTGASNALLKTLEEPPSGVCFVLATTDPNKVLPTIRSRTQHFEFRLLSAEELESYVRWIAQDAGLDLSDQAVAHVVRVGRGSARDTLSALDQVVAAGGVVDRAEPVELLVDALAAGDTGAAVGAVAEALTQGHDPRVLAEHTLAALRHAFLSSVGAELPTLLERDRELAERWAAELGTRRTTRALERIGSAIVDMRHAADPRVPLEVAVVSLTAEVDQFAELEARVTALESGRSAASAGGGSVDTPTVEGDAPDRTRADATTTAPSGRSSGAAQARAALGAATSPARPEPAPARPARAPARPGPAPTRPGRTSTDSVDGRGAPAADPGSAGGATPQSTRPAEVTTTGQVSGDPAAPAAPAGPMAPAAPAAPSGPAAPAAPTDGALDAAAVARVFTEQVVPSLTGKARAILSRVGVASVQGSTIYLSVENSATMARVEDLVPSLSETLGGLLGGPVELTLAIGTSGPAAAGPAPARPDRAEAPAPASAPVPDPAAAPEADSAPAPDPAPAPAPAPSPAPASDAVPDPDTPSADAPPTGADDDESDEYVDVSELEDASDVATSGVARLTQAFPGAVVVEDGTTDGGGQ